MQSTTNFNLAPTDINPSIDAAELVKNLDLLKKLNDIVAELADNQGVPKRWVEIQRQDGATDGFWAFTSDVTLSHVVPLLAKKGIKFWYNVTGYNELTRIIDYQFIFIDVENGQLIQSNIKHPLDDMDTPTQSWNSSDTTAIKRCLRANCMLYDPTEEDPEYVLARMAQAQKPNISLVDNRNILITRLERNKNSMSDRSPKVAAYGHAPDGLGAPEDNLDKLEVGLWEEQLARIEQLLGRGRGQLMLAIQESGGVLNLTQPLMMRVTARGQYLNMHRGIQPSGLDNPAIRYAFLMGSGRDESELCKMLLVEKLEDFTQNIQMARQLVDDHIAAIDKLASEQDEEHEAMLSRLTEASNYYDDQDQKQREKRKKRQAMTQEIRAASAVKVPHRTEGLESLSDILNRNKAPLDTAEFDRQVEAHANGSGNSAANSLAPASESEHTNLPKPEPKDAYAELPTLPSHIGDSIDVDWSTPEPEPQPAPVELPLHQRSHIFDSIDVDWSPPEPQPILGSSGTITEETAI